MACVYYKDNKSISSKDLVEEFLRENGKLVDSSIYSSESIEQTILDISNYDEYQNSPFQTTYDFVVSEHPEFSSFPALRGKTRLAPEIILKNRLSEFVKSNINKEFDSNYEITETLQEYVKLVKEDAELASVENDVLFPILNDIMKTIEVEEATKSFSGDLHRLISLSVQERYNEFDSFLEEVLESNPLIFGELSEQSRDDWTNKIKITINNIKNKVRGNNSDSKILNNIYLVADSNIGIKGKIDLATVDSYGKVDIYEIKVSRKEFSTWDNAKKLTSDWELGLLRQMLGKHINIDDIRLHIIPIELGTLGNINSFHLGDFQNRSGTYQSGLQRNGVISDIAEKFIPRTIFTKVDLERNERIKSELGQLLYPDYKVKTDIEQDSDLESVMNAARKRFEITGKWSKYNPYEIEGLDEKWITADSEEEFESKVKLLVDHIKNNENLNVYIIKEAIATSLKDSESIKTSEFAKKLDVKLNRILHNYLNEDWEVMTNIPEADAMGIIVLKNTKSGMINIFNLTASNLRAMSPIEGYTFGELEQIKAMYFVNEFKKELFPTSSYRLGQIIIFNPVNKTPDADVIPVSLVLDKFRSRSIQQGFNESFIKITENNLSLIEDLALQNLMTSKESYVGKHKDDIVKIFGLLGDSHVDDISKENLIKVRNELIRKFPHLREKEITVELDFEDQIGVMFALLNVAILSKDGLTLTGDFKGLTRDSLGAGNFKTLLYSFFRKDTQEYDKQRNRIEGIVGGLNWITPDWNISRDMRSIVSLASAGNSATGERMVRMNERLRPYTKEYFENLNYGLVERIAVGEGQSKFKDLFITEPKTGRVHPEFRTKDPYTDNQENALEDFQRKYLKQVLFVINSYMAGLSEKEMDKINPENLFELKANPKLNKRLEDGRYFRVPLVRNSEITRYKDTLSEKGRVLGHFKDEVDNWLDGRELSQFDISNVDAQKMGFFEMYDVYGAQNDEVRAKMIERDGVNYYDLNLDTIAHRVAFNKIRKNVFDMILPTISAYIWTLKLTGAEQGSEVKKQIEYVVNQVKLAIFNEPLIGDEEKTVANGIAFAKKISSWSILAFKWSSLPKELTLGTIRNYLASATGIMKDISLDNVTKAYGKLITIDNKFTDEFNLIDKLNFFYRIHNMDVASIVDKMKTDRNGIMKGVGRMAFLTSTVGDAWNRSAILIARMLQDGSYDAHSLVGGKLVYDPTKDKRFSYYLSERDKHKDKDGKYIPKTGDSKYNEQRRKYLAVLDQLNREGSVLGEPVLTENDLIYKAYTQKERDSLKAYADLMYGAYDKDSQPQILHKLMGITFLQFLQYWPSKMKLWFGKSIEAEDSPIGNFEHAYEMKDGQKIYQYYKLVEKEDGSQEQIITSEDTGDPVHIWMGTPQEGLMLSIGYTIQSLVRGDWDDLKNNPWRKSRVYYAIGDAVFVFLLLGLMAMLFKSLKEENPRNTFSGELINFMDNVNNRMLREHDLWDSTVGAISPEPIWMSWGIRSMTGLKQTLEGERAIGNWLGQNFGIFETIRGLY